MLAHRIKHRLGDTRTATDLEHEFTLSVRYELNKVVPRQRMRAAGLDVNVHVDLDLERREYLPTYTLVRFMLSELDRGGPLYHGTDLDALCAVLMLELGEGSDG